MSNRDDLRAVTAERDALAATVERVRAVAHEFYKVRGDWYTEGGANALKAALLAALDPKPAFVLPTEVPARIEARPDWIPDDEDGAMTLNLWTDGKDLCWSTEDGDTGYTPDQVMEQFTEHRLLGADE